MIPRIAEGSWVIKQSVGTTPVGIGRKMTTSLFIPDKYSAVSVDVGLCPTSPYPHDMVNLDILSPSCLSVADALGERRKLGVVLW